MKTLIFLTFSLLFCTISWGQKIVIQTNMNVRSGESTDSKIVTKLKQFDELDFISRGKQDLIENHKDYWYKVRTENGKEGYVFGHYTSLKQEGQKRISRKFTDCYFGDFYHLEFEDMDFGYGINQMGGYELCIDDSPNPKYLEKLFEITYNSLVAKTYCDESMSEICVRNVPTIISIKLN